MAIRRPLALLLTLCAAATFVCLGSLALGKLGAYYDELHQATASFVWLGRDAELFARGEVGGVPLFNMTYSGAIKSHLFGAWMWATGRPFTIEGWRWCGLWLGAGGIVAFGVSVASSMPWRRLAVVLALVVTDGTLLVGSRHDWGPIALAFLLRMTMLGLCLRPVGRHAGAAALAFGFLLGFAVYEKLSSLVAIAPLLVLWCVDPARRRLRSGVLVLLGAVVGAAPVILWNLQWLVGAGKFASLGQMGTPATHSLADAVSLLHQIVVMPQGGRVRQFVFNRSAPGWLEALEAVCLVVALICALRGGAPRVRVCALGAALTGIGLWALPSRTDVHHWVLVAPWPYLAVALAVGAGASARLLRWTIAVWLGLRLVATAMLVDLLLGGAAGPRWTPELHRLQAVAAASDATDVFVAGDWGVATQIACGVQGRNGAVVECFATARLPDLSHARRVVLVGLQPPSDVAPTAFAKLRDALAAAGWQPVANPSGLQDLRDLQVLTFARSR